MDPEMLGVANEALNNARMHSYNASPREKGLIETLSKRYPKSKDEDPSSYYEAYAQAMRKLAISFPDDVDIVVMAAESLMNLHPWDMFTKSGETQTLDNGNFGFIRKCPYKNTKSPPGNAPLCSRDGVQSQNPEKAIEIANTLRFRVPGSGHLMHMPSHLYINTGHYHEGTLANERAVIVDSTYVGVLS